MEDPYSCVASWRHAPANTAPRSCSRVSAHSNSDAAAGWGLLLRRLGLALSGGHLQGHDGYRLALYL